MAQQSNYARSGSSPSTQTAAGELSRATSPASNLPAVGPTTPRWRIAIVEDSYFQLTELHYILSKIENCSVVGFRSANEELLDILEDEYDLVVVDHLMPNLSGLEFVRMMRGRQTLATMPVIMLTSSLDPDTKWAAIAAGVTRFELKPIDPCNFRFKVGRMLQDAARVELASA